MEEFFARNRLPVDETWTAEEADAALGALLLRYLRHTCDGRAGAWTLEGRDEHETLRRTCHAAEVLHRLDLDADSAQLVRAAGNWLINVPVRDQQTAAAMHIYPSRFKTLAYLGRFDDPEVQRDFRALLRKEVNGIIRNVGESSVLTTCIALDTLIHLDRAGMRHEVCPPETYDKIVRALRRQLLSWRAPGARGGARRAGNGCEIDNAQDLSYVVGLLLHADHAGVPVRTAANVVAWLTGVVERGAASRGPEAALGLYAALQLAEHYGRDEAVRPALEATLTELRAAYAAGDGARRWDLTQHTLVLRLLLTFHGDAAFTRSVAAHLLREAERRHDAERGLLETELQALVRERLAVRLGAITELSGGFTEDRVYRVPFTYWFPAAGADDGRREGVERPATSMIVKRSTRDSFMLATEQYNQLPAQLRELFVRMPTEAQVHKSGESSSYFLVMEDLTNLYTFRHLYNEFDQRAMSDHHRRLLERAAERSCDAVFRLFRTVNGGRNAFPGTQIARIYLAQIEGKLARAVERVPWLKNPIQGFYVGEQRYKGLDYYLAAVARYAHALQPRALGLTHGDLHARNVMLDRDCTVLKLIDLDKLSRTGDYIFDLATLVQDLAVYRRVSEPERDFGLPRQSVVFAASASAEAGTLENQVSYPALGRPASVALQELVLEATARFADETQDPGWRPRLWLATATALLMRLAFQTDTKPSAVLYGEGVRLLHELTRHLEHGQPLPALLFPVEWPAALPPRPGTPSDLPEWAGGSALLRALHEGLRELGLRTEAGGGAVRYYSERAGEGPLAALTPARRDALARLLLCCEGVEAPPTGVRVQPSARPDERLRTTLLLGEEADAAAVLALARRALGAALDPRQALSGSHAPATRRRG